jgi:hypothetical protein
MDTPARDLLLIRELRLDLLLTCPILKRREFPPPSKKMTVDSLMADFLLERLAAEPLAERQKTPKSWTAPTTVLIRLPVPLPVVFEAGENSMKTLLGFVETPEVPHIVVYDQVCHVLTKFHNEKVIVGKFALVAVTGGDEKIEEMATANDAVLLKGKDLISRNGQTRDFAIFVMSNNWTQESERKIRNELTEIYERVKLWKCKKCKIPFRDLHPCPLGGKHEATDQRILISSFQISGMTLGSVIKDNRIPR